MPPCESCLDKEKRRLESNRRESSAFLRIESRLPRGGFFLFCRRADHREYKDRADNLRGFTSVLSALRLGVWLLDDGQIQLSYRNQGFMFALGAIQRKVFQYCIIADFQSRFAAAKGA